MKYTEDFLIKFEQMLAKIAQPMNIQEAADYLRISKSKMYELVPYIPHSIVGGKKLFLKANLDAFIQENEVRP